MKHHLSTYARATAHGHKALAEAPDEAFRREIELVSGPWSYDQELCEDGRATCLHRFSGDHTVFLTRGGELLLTYDRTESERYGYRLLCGQPRTLWLQLSTQHPEVRPGRNGFLRFWILREQEGRAERFGVFDILRFEALGWGSRAEAVAIASRMNSTLESKGAACSTRRPDLKSS